MFLKVFILGRPGSGKSSVAQFIQKLVSNRGWSAQHVYDYPLLQALFLREITDNVPESQRKFSPRGPEGLKGFDVIDYQMVDTVLYQMADKVRVLEQVSSGDKELLLIEFARDSYENALRIFGNESLQDAYLLYMNLDLETCIERLERRLGDGSKFSHFVSNEIMRRYYFRDDWLEGGYQGYLQGLQSQGIRTYPHKIDNTGSFDQLRKSAKEFVEKHLLRETEPLPAVQKKITQVESAK